MVGDGSKLRVVERKSLEKLQLVGRSRLGEKAVVAKGALEMARRSDDSMVSLDSCWMGREAEVAVMVTSHITREAVRNGRKKLAGKDELRNFGRPQSQRSLAVKSAANVEFKNYKKPSHS
jgi:hypothetical protein